MKAAVGSICLGLAILASGGNAAEQRFEYKCAEPRTEPPRPVDFRSPHGGRSTEPGAPAPSPVQILGCVEEDVALVATTAAIDEIAAARSADADPGVAGVVRRFESPAAREDAIRAWLDRHGASYDASSQPVRVFLGARVLVALKVQPEAAAYATYPVAADAGELCLTFVRAGASPAYVASLNNWCSDMLDERVRD